MRLTQPPAQALGTPAATTVLRVCVAAIFTRQLPAADILQQKIIIKVEPNNCIDVNVRYSYGGLWRVRGKEGRTCYSHGGLFVWDTLPKKKINTEKSKHKIWKVRNVNKPPMNGIRILIYLPRASV